MTHIEQLQTELARRGLDALLLFSDPATRWATGFAFTDGAVAVTRASAVLFTDSRYIEAARAGAEGVEVAQFDAARPLTDCLRAALGDCRAVGAEAETLPHARWERIGRCLGCDLRSADDIVTALRAVKDPREIAAITAAQRIAERALAETLNILRPGVTEREIAAELTCRMLRAGGEGNSFDPIAVTGANSSKPHGVPGDTPVRAGDFVTMDFGTIVGGFHSDMTRTVAVGHATDEMREVYDAVLRAQAAGIALMDSRHTGAEVHAAAEEIIAAAGYAGCFGHGFGHGVGLEIHEAPSASPRNEKPLPAGAVVTAEPGIYLPGKFGVRIEDMIHVTAGGPVNLTAAPKELLII